MDTEYNNYNSTTLKWYDNVTLYECDLGPLLIQWININSSKDM